MTEIPFELRRLTGLRCPAPQCRYAEVWIVSLKDWKTHGRILLHCRNGHLLYWRAEEEALAQTLFTEEERLHVR